MWRCERLRVLTVTLMLLMVYPVTGGPDKGGMKVQIKSGRGTMSGSRQGLAPSLTDLSKLDTFQRSGSTMRTRITRRVGEPCFMTRASLFKPVPGEVVAREEEELLEDLGRDPYAKAGGYCDRSAKPLRFKPEGCRMRHRKFDPAEFLKLIAGRRLALLGDSVTRQWFEYLLGRLRRLAAPKGIVTIPYGQLSYKRPGCGLSQGKSNSTSTGPGGINTQCYVVRAGSTKFCHTFTVPGATGRKSIASLCYIYANRDPLDRHNMPAYNALRRGDVVVASTGLHMNVVGLMQNAMDRFASHLPRLKRARFDRPILIWREGSAQHFGVKPSGYWPPLHWVKERQSLRNVNPRKFRCTDIPLQQLEKFEFRNAVARKVLSKMQVPILPVWRTTALEHLAHPQSLRGGRSADCTHFCPRVGGVFEMWIEMLYNYLDTVLQHEEFFSNQFTDLAAKLP